MTFVLGREIVAEALRSEKAEPYIKAGLTLEFMGDAMHPAFASVFTGQDYDAWMFVLTHHAEHRTVPSTSLFRHSFPEQAYALPESRLNSSELVSLARKSVQQFETEIGNSEAGRYIDAGDPITAAQVMLETARRVLSQQAATGIRQVWDDPDYDLEARLRLRISRGPGFGIDALDEQFPGFQPGQLITLLGRAKAGKTSNLITSAFHAWLGKKSPNAAKRVSPRRVMIVTTEIDAQGMRDRLAAYGAKINPGRFIASTEDYHILNEEAVRLRDFWAANVGREAAEALEIVQPFGSYGVADIEADAERCEPDMIYVDGFYFLTDPATKRMGSHWEAHDNLARELKSLAMKLRVPIMVTHQVREKQLGKAGGGLDDGSMMGGTGLRMASDMVFGIDIDLDTKVVTINNTASRNGYIKTVTGEWDWEQFRFNGQVREPEYEEEVYATD